MNQEKLHVVWANRRSEGKRHGHGGDIARHPANRNGLVLNGARIRNAESAPSKGLAWSVWRQRQESKNCDRQGPTKTMEK
jgi:hypothetical protein